MHGSRSEIEVSMEEDWDDKLVAELREDELEDRSFEYTEGAKERPSASIIKGHVSYPRDRRVACNALVHAHYLCEIDPMHPTFIRKNSGKPYTEPHHLIPMAFQDQFSVSLDREQNIVSLCSNCHNEIHYGRDSGKLIEKLFNDRQNVLESIGIEITQDDLFQMYT